MFCLRATVASIFLLLVVRGYGSSDVKRVLLLMTSVRCFVNMSDNYLLNIIIIDSAQPDSILHEPQSRLCALSKLDHTRLTRTDYPETRRLIQLIDQCDGLVQCCSEIQQQVDIDQSAGHCA